MWWTYMLPDDFFVLAFFFQFSHDIFGRDQDLRILLQKFGEVLEQRVLGSQEIELEEFQKHFIFITFYRPWRVHSYKLHYF